jgi:hypothetical protein
VVDAVPPAAFGQDEAGFGEHGQMLHDREPAELREPGGQFTGRGRRGPEPVEQAPAPRAGQRPPDVRSGFAGHGGIP